jgi:hypothetical protein
VNRESESKLSDFIARFGKTESDIVALIIAELATGKLGTLRERRRVSRRVGDALAALEGATLPRVAALVRSGYISGRQRSKAPVLALNATDREAVKILADNLSGRIQDTVTVVGRRTDDILRKEGLRAAAIAQARQGNVGLASQKMIEKLQNKGVSAFTDRAGRQWGLEAYARMATRQTMREAETHGARNLMLRQNFDLVQIAYPNRREFDPDSACSPHHNKVYSLTGRADGFPVLNEDDLPPFHPECFHFLRLAPGAVEEREGFMEAAA